MPLHVLPIREAEMGFVADEVQANVNVNTRSSLGAKTIKVELPSGARIVRVTAFAIIVALNNANVANKMALELEVNGHNVFNKPGVFGFPPYDGLTSMLTITQEATEYVAEGDNTLEAFVTQGIASSVTYTVTYTLIATYG